MAISDDSKKILKDKISGINQAIQALQAELDGVLEDLKFIQGKANDLSSKIQTLKMSKQNIKTDIGDLP